MSFFPIQLGLEEYTHSLWICDAAISLTPPVSEEMLLKELAELLRKIEKAVRLQFSFTNYSENFTRSPDYPQILITNSHLPFGPISIQCMLKLVSYIQSWINFHFPLLTASPYSLGSQMCTHTIWVLTECITSQSQLNYHFIEKASTSSAITPSLLLMPFPSSHIPRPLSTAPAHIATPYLAITESLRGQKRSLTKDDDQKFEETDEEIIDVVGLSPIHLITPLREEPNTKKQKLTQELILHIPQRPLSPLPLEATLSNIGQLLSPTRIETSSDEESEAEAAIIPQAIPIPITRSTEKATTSEECTTKKAATTKKQKNLPTPCTPYIEMSCITIQSFYDTSFLITPRRYIGPSRDMKIFLEDVKKAIYSPAYHCKYTIPEIAQHNPTSKPDILKTLYVLVLRNYFFFKKQRLSQSAEILLVTQETLNLINRCYCSLDELDEAEEANDLQHHPDLIPYTRIDFSSPSYRINVKASLSRIHITKTNKNQNCLWIKKSSLKDTKDIPHQLFVLKEAVNNEFLYLQSFKEQKQLFISCRDGSYLLNHPQKKPISQKQAVKILEDIITKNKEIIPQYFSLIPPDHPIKQPGRLCTEITKKIEAIETLVTDWKKTLTQTSEEVTEDVLMNSSDDDYNIRENENKYLTILYHAEHNTFSIIAKSQFSSTTNFLKFLSNIDKAKNSHSFICLYPIEDITHKASQNRKIILSTLFYLVCKYAQRYQKKAPVNGKQLAIPSNLSQKVTEVLQELNRLYCEISPSTTSTIITPAEYHPSLNSIATELKLSTFFTSSENFYSYTFHKINITKLNIEIMNNTLYNQAPGQLLVALAKNISTTCSKLIIISQQPSTLIFNISSPDQSYPLETSAPVFSVSRDKALRLTQNILIQIKEDISRSHSFREHLGKTGFKNLINYLSITFSYIEAALTNAPFPTAPLPTILQPSIHVSLFHISRNRKTYTCKLNSICSLRDHRHCISIYNHTKVTCQGIARIITSTQTLKEAIFCKNKHTDISTEIPKDSFILTAVIPLFYTGLQQNILQLRQHLKERKQLPQSIINLKKSIALLEEHLTLLETKWSALHPRGNAPSLHSYPYPFEETLFLSSIEMQQLQQYLDDPA